jgi:hypothetical protein
MKKQVLGIFIPNFMLYASSVKFVTPKAHCSDLDIVVQELVTSPPKGKCFSLRRA